ncbi:MAG: DUF3144 domain-containing protein [Rhodothermales bacterium]
MNTERPGPEFWERADEIIAAANEQCKNATIGKVSSSLLYAAARFNSFNVAFSAECVEEMKKDKNKAIEYLLVSIKRCSRKT